MPSMGIDGVRDSAPRGGFVVRQKSCASLMRRRVHSFQIHGSASCSESVSFTSVAVFSASSSSHRKRGPQRPAQPCPLAIHKPILAPKSASAHIQGDVMGDTHKLKKRTRIRHAVQAALAMSTPRA